MPLPVIERAMALFPDADFTNAYGEEWGEAVVGVVVLKHPATVESLQQWVRDRMRSSRVPELLEFWDELPYNEIGKLLRREVTESLSGTA